MLARPKLCGDGMAVPGPDFGENLSSPDCSYVNILTLAKMKDGISIHFEAKDPQTAFGLFS